MRPALAALVVIMLMAFGGAASAQSEAAYSDGVIQCPDGGTVLLQTGPGAQASPSSGTMRMLCEIDSAGRRRDKALIYANADGGGTVVCPGGRVLQLSTEQVEESSGRLDEVCQAIDSAEAPKAADPYAGVKPMSKAEVAARFESSLTAGQAPPPATKKVPEASEEPKATASGSDVLWTSIVSGLLVGLGLVSARFGKHRDIVLIGIAAAVFEETNIRIFGRTAFSLLPLEFAPIAMTAGWAAMGAPVKPPASWSWLARGAIVGLLAVAIGALMLLVLQSLPVVGFLVRALAVIQGRLLNWSEYDLKIVSFLPIFLQPQILVFAFAAALDFFFFYFIAAAISGVGRRST